MEVALIVLASLFALWLLVNAKRSRPDGIYLRTHPYRRLLWFIMPTRAESIVYLTRKIRADALLTYLDQARPQLGANMTHVLVAGVGIALAENPAMNRFVVGKRLYQRKGRHITFSMKRKKLDKKAKLAVVKMEMLDGETFAAFTKRVNDQIGVQRSGKKTYADREFSLFNMLPRYALEVAVRFLRLLDYHNLLPGFFIKGDGMYTSLFLANLGSLQMDAGYHHLYEWGTCPLFVMAGKVQEEPWVEDGVLTVAKVLTLTFSFDERIDDGLTANFGIQTLENVLAAPEQFLGCIAEDGSDSRPMWPRELPTSDELARSTGRPAPD